MGRKPALGLRELESELRDNSARARAILGSIDTGTARKRPREGAWSVVECIAHLNLSADYYFPLWDAAIPQASRRAGLDPYRMDLWGRLLYWSLEQPPKFRSTTPQSFVPQPQLDPESTLAGFLDRQERIQKIMSACDGLAIDRLKIPSPFNQRVRYSVWSSLVVTAAHERRHMWQAEQALAALGIAIGH